MAKRLQKFLWCCMNNCVDDGKKDIVDGKDCNSVKPLFEHFMKKICKYSSDSQTCKGEYALKYFGSKSYLNPLFYKCLQIDERFSGATTVTDMTALSYYKTLLQDFIDAFSMVAEKERDDFVYEEIKNVENIKQMLSDLMKHIPDSIIEVKQKFSEKEILQITEKYVTTLPDESMPFVCPGLTRQLCQTRLIGFVVLKQFCVNLECFKKCLKDLKKIAPN